MWGGRGGGGCTGSTDAAPRQRLSQCCAAASQQGCNASDGPLYGEQAGAAGRSLRIQTYGRRQEHVVAGAVDAEVVQAVQPVRTGAGQRRAGCSPSRSSPSRATPRQQSQHEDRPCMQVGQLLQWGRRNLWLRSQPGESRSLLRPTAATFGCKIPAAPPTTLPPHPLAPPLALQGDKTKRTLVGSSAPPANTRRQPLRRRRRRCRWRRSAPWPPGCWLALA